MPTASDGTYKDVTPAELVLGAVVMDIGLPMSVRDLRRLPVYDVNTNSIRMIIRVPLSAVYNCGNEIAWLELLQTMIVTNGRLVPIGYEICGYEKDALKIMVAGEPVEMEL